ncbi:MAG TPA: hypothetical protein PLH65_01665 [bacterium]|nr:hypothetical protein [bacterium]
MPVFEFEQVEADGTESQVVEYGENIRCNCIDYCENKENLEKQWATTIADGGVDMA